MKNTTFSVSELSQKYCISSQLMNKVLCKLGILKRINNVYVANPWYGYTTYFSEHFDAHKQKLAIPKARTQIKLKSERLLAIQAMLHNLGFAQIKDLSAYFEQGQFALSFRKKCTYYNPTNKYDLFQLSYRTSRCGSSFDPSEYVWLSDAAANELKRKFQTWTKAFVKGFNSKGGTKCPVLANSQLASEVFELMNKLYFTAVKNASLDKHVELARANKEAAKQFLQ